MVVGLQEICINIKGFGGNIGRYEKLMQVNL